jgi:Putative transposase
LFAQLQLCKLTRITAIARWLVTDNGAQPFHMVTQSEVVFAVPDYVGETTHESSLGMESEGLITAIKHQGEIVIFFCTGEFLRRFLMHVLPRGFVRIRFFGFLANRSRATLLPQCRLLLLNNLKPHITGLSNPSPAQSAIFRCPICASPMIIVETFPRCNASPFTTRSPNFDSS